VINGVFLALSWRLGVPLSQSRFSRILNLAFSPESFYAPPWLDTRLCSPGWVLGIGFFAGDRLFKSNFVASGHTSENFSQAIPEAEGFATSQGVLYRTTSCCLAKSVHRNPISEDWLYFFYFF
jgi:hypothetical protein